MAASFPVKVSFLNGDIYANTDVNAYGDAINALYNQSPVAQTLAKGDLLVGTGAATVSKLSVGANNTVLVADSAQATGTKWAAVDSTLLATGAVTSGKIGAAAIDSLSYFTTATGANGVRPTIVCTSATRPSATNAGQIIFETDTTRVLISNATTWHYVKPQTGTFTIAFSGSNQATGTVTFSSTMSSAMVVASCQGIGATNAEAVALNVQTITTTGFSYKAYNTWGTSYTQSITGWYIAMENW